MRSCCSPAAAARCIIAPERWHAYVLYCLNENMEEDFQSINHFLDKVLSPARSLRWMRLDNAAKIYPAAKRRNWNNFFRLSATLTEPVDTAVLRSALDVTARRFPSMAVRLRRGVFWYYLEQIPKAPAIQPEKSCPLAHAPFDRGAAAAPSGCWCTMTALPWSSSTPSPTAPAALIFLKTLLAEYLCQKYGITVPAEDGVLGRLEEPDEEELEDSFLRYAGDVKASRKEATAYHLSGTPEPDGFKNLVTLMVPADALRSCAREYGVTVTELLAAAMMQAIDRPAGGEGATPQPPQAGEGADPRESAESVSQPHAAELRLLHHPGDRSRVWETSPSGRSAPPSTTGWGWRTTRTPCRPSSPPTWPASGPPCCG